MTVMQTKITNDRKKILTSFLNQIHKMPIGIIKISGGSIIAKTIGFVTHSKKSRPNRKILSHIT